MSIPNLDTYSPLSQLFFSHMIETEAGCWEWQGTRRKGYPRFSIGNKHYSVHRIVFAEHVGPIPKGYVVMHDCDNPPCCNPKHLKAGTQAENVADMVAKGRNGYGIRSSFPVDMVRSVGSKHGNAKLTEDVVREIRATYSQGKSQAELANEYGVHQSQISRALNGKLWAHV